MKKVTMTLGLIMFAHYMAISAPNGSTLLLYGIGGLCAFITVVALILVATNVMNLEAHKHGLDITKENFSAIPGVDDFFPKKVD